MKWWWNKRRKFDSGKCETWCEFSLRIFFVIETKKVLKATFATTVCKKSLKINFCYLMIATRRLSQKKNSLELRKKIAWIISWCAVFIIHNNKFFISWNGKKIMQDCKCSQTTSSFGRTPRGGTSGYKSKIIKKK